MDQIGRQLLLVLQRKAQAAAKRQWRSSGRGCGTSAAQRYKEAAGDVLKCIKVLNPAQPALMMRQM